MDDILLKMDGEGGATFREEFDAFAKKNYGMYLYDARQISDKYEQGILGTICK